MEFNARNAFKAIAAPALTAAGVAAVVALAAFAATPAHAADVKPSSLKDNWTPTFTAKGGFRYKTCEEAQEAVDAWAQGSLVKGRAGAAGEVTLKLESGKTCKLVPAGLKAPAQ